MTAHTTPAINDARMPRDRVATASTTRHTAAHGTMNDFANAPTRVRRRGRLRRASRAPSPGAQSQQRAEHREHRGAAEEIRRAELLRQHRERRRTPNSEYAPTIPHGPARIECRVLRANVEYAHEHILERREHRDEAREVHGVNRGTFTRRRRADDGARDADQRRIERTPVQVDEARPIASDDRVAHVEIGDPVRAHGVAMRIR